MMVQVSASDIRFSFFSCFRTFWAEQKDQSRLASSSPLCGHRSPGVLPAPSSETLETVLSPDCCTLHTPSVLRSDSKPLTSSRGNPKARTPGSFQSAFDDADGFLTL